MFEQRKQQVLAKVAECIANANRLYNITLPQPQIRFDLQGRCAGQAGVRWGSSFLRFNCDMMRNGGWDHLLNDTVPHEVAHLVCYHKPALGRQHNWGWKSVCRALGGSGERCHNEEVEYRGGTYYYTSTSGHVIAVSPQRHSKIQRGVGYTFQGKGRVTRECQYSRNKPAERVVAVTPPAAPAPAQPVAAPTPVLRLTGELRPAGGTNASQVRWRIGRAKAQGEGMDEVILFAVQVLGMTRNLARAYVRNNWNKA